MSKVESARSIKNAQSEMVEVFQFRLQQAGEKLKIAQESFEIAQMHLRRSEKKLEATVAARREFIRNTIQKLADGSATAVGMSGSDLYRQRLIEVVDRQTDTRDECQEQVNEAWAALTDCQRVYVRAQIKLEDFKKSSMSAARLLDSVQLETQQDEWSETKFGGAK
jgi:hypothetical protein